MLRALSARCGRKTSELCPFDAVKRKEWAGRGENVPRNGMNISSCPIIFPFSDDSIAKSERFYQLSFSLDAEFLKVLVPQEISDNASSEMFPPARIQAVCADAIALSKTLRAEFSQSLSEELRSRRRKESDLVFETIE